MTVKSISAHAQAITQLAWSHDGRYLASASLDNIVKIWDATNNYDFVTEFRGHSEAVSCVAWSPDDRLLASGSADKTIKIWDLESGKMLQALARHKDFVRSLDWSAKDNLLISTGEDGRICFWNTSSWVLEIARASKHGWSLTVKIAQNGRTLLSAGGDQSIRWWDMSTREEKARLNGHRKWVDDVAWLSATSFASASGDKTIRIWDLLNGTTTRILEGHTDKVRSLSLSADGTMLASKSDDGTVKIWDTREWVQLSTITELNADTYWPPRIAFHPKHLKLASFGDQQGEIRINDIERADKLLQKAPADGVKYTASKIVLIGESGAGKSGLGWRLAHDQFKPQESTHGQQFWVLEKLHKLAADGVESEVILWDLAGQHDYRVIHGLFLDDLDLALLVYDPSDNDPFAGMDFWIKLLMSRFQNKAPVILVAAKADVSALKMSRADVEAFCKTKGLAGGLAITSAKTGAGIDNLLNLIASNLAATEKTVTSTTLAFKLIKDYILKIKERSADDKSLIMLTEQALIEQIRVEASSDADAASLLGSTTPQQFDTAIGHLAKHGHIRTFPEAAKETIILLFPDLFVNLAADFVMAARTSEDGLGSLDEGRLRAGHYLFDSLAGMLDADKRVLIDAAIRLFIDKDVAIRETVGKYLYLIFPELINRKYKPDQDDQVCRGPFL